MAHQIICDCCGGIICKDYFRAIQTTAMSDQQIGIRKLSIDGEDYHLCISCNKEMQTAVNTIFGRSAK